MVVLPEAEVKVIVPVRTDPVLLKDLEITWIVLLPDAPVIGETVAQSTSTLARQDSVEEKLSRTLAFFSLEMTKSSSDAVTVKGEDELPSSSDAQLANNKDDNMNNKSLNLIFII
jgi:hypothetical protein